MRPAAAVVVCLLARVSSLAPSPSFGPSDALLARLFTPLHAPAGSYVVWTSAESIDCVASRLRAMGPAPAGAWSIERAPPADAFGSAARYDRYRVARLYGADWPRVAHGPLLGRLGMVTPLTLVSPYPDASLTFLHPGTLIIALNLHPEQPISDLPVP